MAERGKQGSRLLYCPGEENILICFTLYEHTRSPVGMEKVLVCSLLSPCSIFGLAARAALGGPGRFHSMRNNRMLLPRIRRVQMEPVIAKRAGKPYLPSPHYR